MGDEVKENTVREQLSDEEESAKGAQDTPETAGPDSLEEGTAESLMSQLQQKEEESRENYNRFLRAQADMENLRRRVKQEKEELLRYGSLRLLESLLPVLDNFERALAATSADEGSAQDSLLQGLQMIQRQMIQAMRDEGLEEIEAEGKGFDPNVHQAVMQVEAEGVESGVVVEVLQRGYRLHERVLRPAMVKVSQ